MAAKVACVGLTILDVLGRPVKRIPPGGDLDFIDEIRLTVAGTARRHRNRYGKTWRIPQCLSAPLATTRKGVL